MNLICQTFADGIFVSDLAVSAEGYDQWYHLFLDKISLFADIIAKAYKILYGLNRRIAYTYSIIFYTNCESIYETE